MPKAATKSAPEGHNSSDNNIIKRWLNLLEEEEDKIKDELADIKKDLKAVYGYTSG